MSHDFFEKSIRRSTALQALNRFRHVLMGREQPQNVKTEVSILLKAFEALEGTKNIDELDNIISAGLDSSSQKDECISIEIIQIICNMMSGNDKYIGDSLKLMFPLLNNFNTEYINTFDAKQIHSIISSIESIIHHNSISGESFRFGNISPAIKGF